MKYLQSILPGHEQISSEELETLKFKAEGYDRVDDEINRGIEFAHRMTIDGDMGEYYDGMNAAYMNIYKELRKNELWKGKDRRNLPTVSAGSDDIPW